MDDRTLLERAATTECQCFRCIVDRGDLDSGGWPVAMTRMILCETCGCKRCPHATDHRFACTDSNESGQPGSRYGRAAAELGMEGEGK